MYLKLSTVMKYTISNELFMTQGFLQNKTSKGYPIFVQGKTG